MPPPSPSPRTSPVRVVGGGSASPLYHSIEHRGLLKGIAYGPSPETRRGVLLPNDDFMSDKAAMLWASSGRGDLASMRSLGANTVRLYGNDPSEVHTAFLDESDRNGLGVIAGMSDWPFLQMPGNCRQTQHNCYAQIYEAYKQNLLRGFTVNTDGRRTYHPALRAMIIINEPEIGKFDRSKTVQCKVVASAFDGMLQAERDVGVVGTPVAFSVTYSYANFYGQSAVGQMEMLYACMRDPSGKGGGYVPTNDLLTPYLKRFVNAFNTYSPADNIRGQFLKNYAASSFWRGSVRIPVFIGEYHAPSESQDSDLYDMLRSARDDRYPFFLGYSFFEFQARYDKAHNAEHEMSFGMFGLNEKCTIGTMDFFGRSYPVYSLYPRQDVKGKSMPSALARAFGGDAGQLDLSCKGGQASPDLHAQHRRQEDTYHPRDSALVRPSDAPTFTFYVYRSQSDENYPPLNTNAATLSGVLWYLSNEVVNRCDSGRGRGEFGFRRFKITRILRYKITMKAPQPLLSRGMNFGARVAFDSGKNTGAWEPSKDKKAYDVYGYHVGCSILGKGPYPICPERSEGYCPIAYPEAYWFSLPGPCPTQDVTSKSSRCKLEEPGGYCKGSPTGQGNCTWTYEDAGDVNIDDVVGITQKFGNHQNFCRKGRDPLGAGCGWPHGEVGAQVDRAFRAKYPDLPSDGDLKTPPCDFNKDAFYRGL